MGLLKVGPYNTSKGKPMITFLPYPMGACIESTYCMEMFQKKNITPCVINCPQKAISILKLEDLPKLLAGKKSGDGLYIQIFK
jgi:Fe-S-cluster-containing dehydrogenase component